MKTQNIIQASVNVIKLVNLKKGDVFKIVKADSYDSGITFNIVVELYNDGENSFIEVLQYEKSYSEIKAKMQTFNGTDDIAIFPAKLDEVEEYFKSSLEQIGEDIEKDKKNLQSKIVSYEKAQTFVASEMSKQIQEAEFKEQTIEEYQADKALKESKIKELKEDNPTQPLCFTTTQF